jgi:hypothetical protein
VVSRYQLRGNNESKWHSFGSFDLKQGAALTYDRDLTQCGEDKPLGPESTTAAEEEAARQQLGQRIKGGVWT